ncbi:ABC transporter ATP-binding protein/permease wht-1-like [Oppia nitens]|uniref:ABC transporter ATP-binding protein/permease wht-1-like n=1 Tax=Oppia nitens TaxID=1686743 RepID=UPI0023DA8D8D|nr:ABC transporter ATP-binding protein/permease wht-1-like [Oppia nitens]
MSLISWHNIDVYSKPLEVIPVPYLKKYNKHPIRILNNVSGYANSGHMLAIMGASGSGKTTLLNVLAHRYLHNYTVQGTVMLDNNLANINQIRSISAYVEQDYQFIGTLTVAEHLAFHSQLRMNGSMSALARDSRVKQIMTALDLDVCANTMIESPFTGQQCISGGERKRLAFALELLSDPSIMFCDEPTTGLDSFMALNVVQVLRDMAQSGRTVICTVHQPSSEVFGLFSHLLLLMNGELAYFGPKEYFLI